MNENSNGLLRRDGLPKKSDFNISEESEIISVANYRNNIPRKSLGYKTPIEVFMDFVYPCLA
ncbi:conserved hypothetical protein [Treponema phagedenis]|uniref:IS30 family transposase n=1 Tax=Treponema phagedenis TaxID=162 RepID=A0A0B7GX53_TREPH|nr:hypothetical protein [Treponema phagedenis]CEM63098.1 conserved hypothetical protein [Treponema phagedenis]